MLHHVNYILKHHEALYNEMVACMDSDELSNVFVEININNFGHAMAYLTLIYLMKDSSLCRAVRLVTTSLKSFDFSEFKIEESCFRRMIRHIFML